MDGFTTMAKSALAPDVLSTIDKELIAVAIGVVARCEGCPGFHVGTWVCLGVSHGQFTGAGGVQGRWTVANVRGRGGSGL